MNIIVPGIFLLSGICAYAALTHLAAGARRPLDPTHLLFSGMCALLRCRRAMVWATADDGRAGRLR
jgi:hypothetical protein